MANPFPSDPFLSRGFEPIRMECDYADLIVEGQVPPDLNGSLYRVGPNPQVAPRGRYNPLLGDGMVHAFHLHNGRVSHRNRWVRTIQWKREREAARALFGAPGFPAESDPSVAGVATDGVANTNLVWHANRLLVLEEGHAPIELDPLSLDTIGPWRFDNQLPSNMTAHPKIDPESGEMLFFANLPKGRLTGEIAFYAANRAGILDRSARFKGPFSSIVHDFAITKDFLIFPICPVTLSIERVRTGAPLIAWEPEKGTHVAIMPRTGGAEDIRWFAGPPCMAWHSMNAFNDGDRIVVDVCQQAAVAFPLADGSMPDQSKTSQYLTRWTFDWSNAGGFEMERLSEVRCEYPRIDNRRSGLNYRHGYLACEGGPGSGDPFHRGIAHFDHLTRRMRTYCAGPRCAVAEPVFVAKSPDAKDGEGYLLTNIFDEQRNTSHLAIFDAEDIEHGPVARAHLDHRMPVGFHACWRPDPARQG
ncbi:MAG: carotenoid oxygenase family protein [Candidatus Binataceae bacterium]